MSQERSGYVRVGVIINCVVCVFARLWKEFLYFCEQVTPEAVLVLIRYDCRGCVWGTDSARSICEVLFASEVHDFFRDVDEFSSVR